MLSRKTSAKLSLGICIASAAALAALLICFPRFFSWFYMDYHRIPEATEAVTRIFRIVVTSFYLCAPFAAAALYMLIRLLKNLLDDRVFIHTNVVYLRGISWCCYAVFLVTFAGGFLYMPLFIIAFATGVVGTLLRVVKNVMHAAEELREENDLTI